jgi:hypothetical protein
MRIDEWRGLRGLREGELLLYESYIGRGGERGEELWVVVGIDEEREGFWGLGSDERGGIEKKYFRGSVYNFIRLRRVKR